MRLLTVSAVFVTAALAAVEVDPDDANSFKDAAKSVAKNLISYYNGNEDGKIPGILPGPPPQGDYYWWEAGVMWNTLIDYWHYTGDTAYNDLVTQGILWQVGPDSDFMPINVTAQMANDDQGFWAMAAMTAAETDLKNPSSNNATEWLALAKSVFSGQASRWNDSESCGGGLRWQVPPSNTGYDYKNSISTGVLFNVAARLGRLTRNATYADWAGKTWDWMESVGFLKDGAIYDGAHVDENCSDISKAQFSYTAGVFIHGAAYMYNYTAGDKAWETRLTKLVNTTIGTFFNEKGVPIEITCESNDRCSTDMLAFKGILLRSLASAMQVAPYIRASVRPLLEGVALAAAASCNDTHDKGAECGFVWTNGKDDGKHGVGQQMNTLAALSVMFVDQAAAPGVNNNSGGTGGNRTGSPTQSGTASSTPTAPGKNGAERVGAGLITGAALAAAFSVLLV